MSDLPSNGPQPELLMSFPGEPMELTNEASQTQRSADSPRQPAIVYDRWPKPKPEPTAREAAAESAAMLARAEGLRLSLDELRTIGSQLVRAYGRLDEQYQGIEGRSTQALDALATIERRVGSLDRLRDLTSLIDERVAALKQLDEEIESRAAALASHDASVSWLESRASLAATKLEKQVTDFEARCATLDAADGPMARVAASAERVDARERAASDGVARRENALFDYERRLGEATATASGLASTLASLERQTAALMAERASIAEADQALTRAQQLAAATATDLQRVRVMQDDLEQTLLQTRSEARRVARLVRRRAVELVVRRRVLAPALAWIARIRRGPRDSHPNALGNTRRGPRDWGSARSADVTLSLAAGASAVVVTALLVGWVSARVPGPEPAVPEAEVAEVTEVAAATVEVPGSLSPRTTDIELPSAPPRALSARRTGQRSSRPARASGRR